MSRKDRIAGRMPHDRQDSDVTIAAVLLVTVYRSVPTPWYYAKYSNLHSTLRRRYHYLYFTDKKTEAQRV